MATTIPNITNPLAPPNRLSVPPPTPTEFFTSAEAWNDSLHTTTFPELIATVTAMNAVGAEMEVLASDTQLREWETDALKMTADSYATEAEDVFVNVWTSDGDGTFTSTPTAEYSALHHKAKALTAETNALVSEVGAEDSNLEAEAWASKATGVVNSFIGGVEQADGTEKSAKQYALDAQAYTPSTHLSTTPKSALVKGTFDISDLVNKLTYDGVTYIGNGATQDITNSILPATNVLPDLTTLTWSDSAGATSTITALSVRLQSDLTDNVTTTSTTITVEASTAYTFLNIDSTVTTGDVSYKILDANNADAVIGTNVQTFTTPVGCTTIKIQLVAGIVDNTDVTINFTTLSKPDGMGSIDFTQASNGTGFYHDRAGGDCIVVSDTATEEVTNGIFSTDTDWTKGTGWTIDAVTNFRADCDGTQVADSLLTTTVAPTTVAGVTYIVEFEVTAYTAGNVALQFDGVEIIPDKTAVGVYKAIAVASDTTGTVDIVADLNFVGSIDNVSVKATTASGSIAFADFAGIDGVSKVHIKSRSTVLSNIVIDGLRGRAERIFTDTTDAEATWADVVASFNIDGVTVDGVYGNGNGVNYILYQTLYTHIKWGTTNHGEAYIEAYNPVTNETMVIYKGSGTVGHEIPQSTGVALDFTIIKSLTGGRDWDAQLIGKARLKLNTTGSDLGNLLHIADVNSISITADLNWNTTETYIMYGKAKSKTWGIVEYVGTGASGNFVATFDSEGNPAKPARVIIKATTVASSWYTLDNKRNEFSGSLDGMIRLESSASELVLYDFVTFKSNGFDNNFFDASFNALGESYIALVEFDTNLDGGGSYEDLPSGTSKVRLSDAEVLISNGYDGSGALTQSLSFAGANTFDHDVLAEFDPVLTASSNNYVYMDTTGKLGATIHKPVNGLLNVAEYAGYEPTIEVGGVKYPRTTSESADLYSLFTYSSDLRLTSYTYVNGSQTLILDNDQLSAPTDGFINLLLNLTVGVEYTLTLDCDTAFTPLSFNRVIAGGITYNSDNSGGLGLQTITFICQSASDSVYIYTNIDAPITYTLSAFKKDVTPNLSSPLSPQIAYLKDPTTGYDVIETDSNGDPADMHATNVVKDLVGGDVEFESVRTKQLLFKDGDNTLIGGAVGSGTERWLHSSGIKWGFNSNGNYTVMPNGDAEVFITNPQTTTISTPTGNGYWPSTVWISIFPIEFDEITGFSADVVNQTGGSAVVISALTPISTTGTGSYTLIAVDSLASALYNMHITTSGKVDYDSI